MKLYNNIQSKIKVAYAILLDKVAAVTFLPEYLSRKGYIYVSFAMPRFVKGNYNWGDDLNFVLGEKLSNRKVIPYRYSLFSRTNYLIIGSVIQWYCNEKSVIWGAGLLRDVDVIEKPKKVLAVRGPLTREVLLKCGVNCPPIYGDPALLLPLFYKPKVQKQYKIGIISHFSEILGKVDIELPKNYKKDNIVIINIMKYGKWSDFVDKVLACEIILSSSLHGLVVAEAYGIPNLWTVFSTHSKRESTFKYRDFYLSINKNIQKPYIYGDLLLKKDLVEYVLEEWDSPVIDIEPLIDSCPFEGLRTKLQDK